MNEWMEGEGGKIRLICLTSGNLVLLAKIREIISPVFDRLRLKQLWENHMEISRWMDGIQTKLKICKETNGLGVINVRLVSKTLG